MRSLFAAMLLMLPAPAALAAGVPDARTGFIQSCERQMYMSAPACACLADRAERQLDAAAIAYLSLPALDVARSTAMARSMTGAERNRIDSFMQTAPHQCEGAK